MLYYISVSINIPNTYKLVDVKNEAEAKSIASQMEQEKLKNIVLSEAKVKSYIHISADNFRCKPDGIYLIRRYSKYVPAVCLGSSHYSGGHENRFELLDSRKRVMFRVRDDRLHKNIGRLLCVDGKIGKDTCATCPAKFTCYTIKERS